MEQSRLSQGTTEEHGYGHRPEYVEALYEPAAEIAGVLPFIEATMPLRDDDTVPIPVKKLRELASALALEPVTDPYIGRVKVGRITRDFREQPVTEKTKKQCRCRSCGYQWIDYPGGWATRTRAQFPGDTQDGCPKCGGLYWDERPLEASQSS